jgi:hypothetical protein
VKKKKRGETKGYFGKDETLCVAGGPEGLQYVHDEIKGFCSVFCIVESSYL